MRNVFVLMVLLSGLSCAAQESGERERVFLRSLEQFDQSKTPSDFAKAGDTWRGLNDDEFQNGAAYYNAGNAYMRAGQFGRAIAVYRKAKLYRPRDPFLDHNLRQAVTSAPGKLTDSPAPWWSLVLFWNSWLSLPEKFFAVTIAGVLAALLVFGGFALRKRSFYWCSALMVFAAALLSIDAYITHGEATGSNRAVVIAETVARKGMGDNYEPAFNQPLKDGAEILVAERTGGWVLAQVPGIGTGWVRREHLAE